MVLSQAARLIGVSYPKAECQRVRL